MNLLLYFKYYNMLPTELSDKLLSMLEKTWLSSEVLDKVKKELSWWEIKVAEIEIKSDEEKPTEDKITVEMVEEMSPEEAKSAFKKHLEKCSKKMDMSEKKKSILDKMSSY